MTSVERKYEHEVLRTEDLVSAPRRTAFAASHVAWLSSSLPRFDRSIAGSTRLDRPHLFTFTTAGYGEKCLWNLLFCVCTFGTCFAFTEYGIISYSCQTLLCFARVSSAASACRLHHVRLVSACLEMRKICFDRIPAISCAAGTGMVGLLTALFALSTVHRLLPAARNLTPMMCEYSCMYAWSLRRSRGVQQ